MASRGRGRGRGRGQFLKQLGVEQGEALPEQVSGPGETFPPLDFDMSASLGERTEQQNYALYVKKTIKENFQMSPYFLQMEVKKPSMEQYSDRYRYFQALATNKGPLKVHCINSIPKELLVKENNKRPAKVNLKNAKPSDKRRKLEGVDVTKTLTDLEKKESNDAEDDEAAEENEGEKRGEEEEMEDDEIDEELDEGTDYARNYYDNEDDGFDDGDDALEEEGCF